MKLTSHACDSDRILLKGEPGLPVSRFSLKHPIPGLYRPSAFGYHDRERFLQVFPDRGQSPVDPVGICVVQEKRLHGIRSGAERVSDKLRAERGAADADDQHFRKTGAPGWDDLPGTDRCAEIFYAFEGVRDLPPDVRRGSELRRPEPVMPRHPVFVGIRDRAALERVHGLVRLPDARLHCPEEVVREVHPAYIEFETEGRRFTKKSLVSLPERPVVHGCLPRNKSRRDPPRYRIVERVIAASRTPRGSCVRARAATPRSFCPCPSAR